MVCRTSSLPRQLWLAMSPLASCPQCGTAPPSLVSAVIVPVIAASSFPRFSPCLPNQKWQWCLQSSWLCAVSLATPTRVDPQPASAPCPCSSRSCATVVGNAVAATCEMCAQATRLPSVSAPTPVCKTVLRSGWTRTRRSLWATTSLSVRRVPLLLCMPSLPAVHADVYLAFVYPSH
jgi:hypothetical protein